MKKTILALAVAAASALTVQLKLAMPVHVGVLKALMI